MSAAGLRVRWYAGHRGEQEPEWLVFGDEAVGVAEILDRWQSPEHRYFKCRGADGDLYLVRHAVGADRWELTLYRRATADD